MSKSILTALCGFWLVCLPILESSSARADHIVVGKSTHTNARLLNLQGGKLVFSTADGKTLSAWLSDVALIVMDKEGAFADFNQAERFMNGGQPAEAIGRYRRAQKMREDFWSDLIAARLVVAADRAGQLQEAVQSFIRINRSEHVGPLVALRLLPDNIPKERNAELVQVVQTLDAAIAVDPPTSQRAALEVLRYEILRRSNNSRASAAARSLCNAALPKGTESERAWTIQCMAIEQVWNDESSTNLQVSIDRAIRDCPESVLPEFLLLKGKVLLKAAQSREEMIRASWPILRVVIHAPNSPRAASALLQAAEVIEKLGQPDKSAELLNECIKHPKVTDELRHAAEAELARLRTPGAKKSP